ncbi:MAG TPA: CRISPR-associated endonuclease Cas3'', partial [Verrucomicrobiae bacterium]|nr:CRISPR-associated endonuclease Cas3'' [Verrucomicrobiae bacterium]
MHYAHSISGRPEVEWQRLEDHLRQVAELAEVFAGPLGDGWGRLAGLWHDAGKFQGAFQKYIRQDADAHVKDRVDHSSVGAVLAREMKALTVPFVVAGHHAGLANRET